MDVFGRGRAATADDYRRFLERNSRAAAKLAAATTPVLTDSVISQPEAEERPRHRSLSRRNSVSSKDTHVVAGGDKHRDRPDRPSGTLVALAMAAQRRKSISRQEPLVNASASNTLRSSQRSRGEGRNSRSEGHSSSSSSYTQRSNSHGHRSESQYHRRKSITQSTSARLPQQQGHPRPRRNTLRHM
uniref:Protein V57 n=1 Tax=Equid alphaherpesvirus 4 TaxID=10331 RepID=A0A109ZY39_9ALPH|nr:protein V57 [Equid alphaherpesvirus 4]